MTENRIRAACIQVESGRNREDNLQKTQALICEAAEQGARLIVTPELTDQMFSNTVEHVENTLPEKDHPSLNFFSDLAARLKITLIIGSIIVKTEATDDKLANRCYVIGQSGQILYSYDKIHLYDVTLPTGEVHKESKIYAPGDTLVVADLQEHLKGAQVGLSVCYDLRFPYLYRDLAKMGANILSIPAAFTIPTGKAHWEVLLRARAIETGSFVLAPAQSGTHEGMRETYGHSMIINPWGDVLTMMGMGTGYVLADLGLDEVYKTRAAIPALQHDRNYEKNSS